MLILIEAINDPKSAITGFLCALSLVLIEAIVLPMLAALRLDNSLEWYSSKP